MASAASSPALKVVKIHELSQALELEALPIQSPTARQPNGTTASSISEKGPLEPKDRADTTTAPLPPPAPPSAAVTTSAAGQGEGTGRTRQRLMLRATDKARQFLPGQPRVSLDPASPATASTFGPASASSPDTDYVLEYLRNSHLTTELDSLLPFMKYIFVATPSHRHIMSLHHQKSRGRDIIVDEHPGLHLVWYYERIFIKPIPAYMLSQAFWTYIADADPAVYRACLGFIRSYYYLIQYEIDFKRACELGLIPKKYSPASSASTAAAATAAELPTYEEFCAFMGSFARQVGDAEVSRRYRYGELRLTRINKTTMLFKFKLAYFHIYPQWGSYFSHILGPIFTVFAILSVVFNALQVTLAAWQVEKQGFDEGWLPFVNLSLYFPVVVMLLVAGLLAAAFLGVITMGVRDLIRTKQARHRRRKGDDKAGDMKYGIIW